MFSDRGGSRNYHIRGEGEKSCLSLTDVSAVIYLLFRQSVPVDHSKGTNISKERGGVQVLRCCGGRGRVGCGGPNTYS